MSTKQKAIGTAVRPEWLTEHEEEAIELRNRQLPDGFAAAFERIRAWGVDTIEGFGCCSGCTVGEFDEIGAYYHSQDINADADDELRFYNDLPDTVYIGFCTDEGGESVAYVGEVVAEAFRAEGFDVEWDDDVRSRIGVEVR